MLTALIKTMRPRQWVTKNIFIFAAIVFDKQLFVLDSFLRTLAGFALFCLISSSVYIFNDIADVEADRQHPEKEESPDPIGKTSHTSRVDRWRFIGGSHTWGWIFACAIFWICDGFIFFAHHGLFKMA